MTTPQSHRSLFPDPPSAFAWMAASALLFALMNFLARLSSVHVAWTIVAGTRALIGAMVAFLVARLRGAQILPRNSPAMWFRTLFGTVSTACTFYALGSPTIALSDSVTLLNLTPIFLALLAPMFLRERSGRRVLFALPLSVGGVLLILRPTFLFGSIHAQKGMFFPASVAVVGALFSSFSMMLLRRVGARESPESIAFHFSVVSAAVHFIISLPIARIPSAGDLLPLVGAGLCGGLAQLAMTRAYALGRAARVAGLGYLSVVGSAALGAWALHEWPRPLTIAGMILVISGGLFVTLVGLREKRVRDSRPEFVLSSLHTPLPPP